MRSTKWRRCWGRLPVSERRSQWITDTGDKGSLNEDSAEAAPEAWVVPLRIQLAGATDTADDYDVFAPPFDDAFREMFR
jgi:hypothetical protein